ncbi:putative zinc finger CCCH domain-containing protein 4, partial [Apostichopus japonicus]
RCQQPINVGTCNAAVPRWGFNDFTGRCQAFSFTGCSGNSNSFANERDCVENCG